MDDPSPGSREVQQIPLTPNLSGVPETMLWALYDRASEAMRPEGTYRDPECVRIYQAIDYDFAGRFGTPLGLAPARAAKMDAVVRRWLARHPRGFVVSLGEGVETQVHRVDNGSMTWLTVDLPEAITFREQFIKPTPRFRHLAMSAFDLDWMDRVQSGFGVFIIAQGLLMYFDANRVRDLLRAISERFHGAEMLFDVLPRVSTHQSHEVTPTWTSPVMPWGLDRNEIPGTFRVWMPGLKKVRSSRYRVGSHRPAIVEDILDALLPHRQRLPCLAHLRF